MVYENDANVEHINFKHFLVLLRRIKHETSMREGEMVCLPKNYTPAPGDFAPADHRKARPKVLQSFAGPFRTPWLRSSVRQC